MVRFTDEALDGELAELSDEIDDLDRQRDELKYQRDDLERRRRAAKAAPALVPRRGESWTVREQVVQDPISGLTIQFDRSLAGTPLLRIYGGEVPCGDREIDFGFGGVAETSIRTPGRQHGPEAAG